MYSTGRKTHDCSEHYELENITKTIFTCDGCKMEGFGPRYVCEFCDDTLHKVCRYPKPTVSHDFLETSIFTFSEIPSLLSGQDMVSRKCCIACRKHIRGFSYRCEVGNLDLHPGCYKLERKICFAHKLFILRMKLSSICNGCSNFGANSDGWAYVSSCNNYHFHTHCFMEKVHDFKMKADEDHSFDSVTFDKQLPTTNHTIATGYAMSTPPTINSSILVSDSHEMTIQWNPFGQATHDCHKHHELTTTGKVVFTCNGCKMHGVGQRYACKLCDLSLHIRCKHPEPTVSHEYFGNSTFVFTKLVVTIGDQYKRCAACNHFICGFSYHCAAKHLDLHPECHRLEKKICFDHMIFHLSKQLSSGTECTRCKLSCTDHANCSCWSYVSECSRYNFHAHCFMERVHEFQMKLGDKDFLIGKNDKVEDLIDLSTLIEVRLKKSEMTEDQVLQELADGKGETKFGSGNIKMFFRILYTHYVSDSSTFTVELVKNTANKFKLTIGRWTKKIFKFIRKILIKIWKLSPCIAATGYQLLT